MATALEPVQVIYCAKCGIPPEYCEYGPDFERLCDPWLKKAHPELHAKLKALRGDTSSSAPAEATTQKKDKPPRPAAPWTTEERLTKFYEEYVPEKVIHDVDGFLNLLESTFG